jgi:NAD(P)-dependent dehydrogenase (short-subunit alcohol dehydrogenase family)
METVVITGANRGIGLELVRQYLARADVRVVAACRTPEDAIALRALVAAHPERLVIVRLDVADEESIASAARRVEAHVDQIDVLINNAGVNPPREQQRLATLGQPILVDTMVVNVYGPLALTRALLPLLKRAGAPRIIQMSSSMGSLERRTYGGAYAYTASKAALNIVTRGMAVDLAGDGAIVVAVDPGWVRTDMGGASAPLAPEESASGILRLIAGLTPEDSGKFLMWNGERQLW